MVKILMHLAFQGNIKYLKNMRRLSLGNSLITCYKSRRIMNIPMYQVDIVFGFLQPEKKVISFKTMSGELTVSLGDSGKLS
jgi:hypothetical protein